MKINVLGTPYTIHRNSKCKEFETLDIDGLTDFTTKEIEIAEMKDEVGKVRNMKDYEAKVIRHELVHAFLFESGLDASSDWARNEEIIDWIAIQAIKLNEAFKKAGVDY